MTITTFDPRCPCPFSASTLRLHSADCSELLCLSLADEASSRLRSQRADLSRIFLFSSREDDGEHGGHGGIEISNCDVENPHHPNNEMHIYEFIEWVIL